MSDYEYRNKTFDYATPSRAGSAGGLLFVGGHSSCCSSSVCCHLRRRWRYDRASRDRSGTPAVTDGTPAVTAPANRRHACRYRSPSGPVRPNHHSPNAGGCHPAPARFLLRAGCPMRASHFRGHDPMLTLTCPYCGITACETELAPGGEAHLKRFGPGSSDDDFEGYLFLRPTPRACISNAGAMPMAAASGSSPRAAPRRWRSSAPIRRRPPNRPPTSSRRSGQTPGLGGIRGMSTRLARGGRLIDRSARRLHLQRQTLRAMPAIRSPPRCWPTASGCVGRSFKYHRPRGIVASGGEEPNALVNLGQARPA
jgi:hypothetical protein